MPNVFKALPELDAFESERDASYDLWMAKVHHRTHKQTPLDFDRHPYLLGILTDESPDLRIRKSTQCGVSELEIVHAMSLVDQRRALFWVFPDERLRNLFVKERIDPTVAATPYYTAMAEAARTRLRRGIATDEVGMKQIGRVAIALVGSNSATSFKSFAADDLIIDEVDQCDQSNLPFAQDRFAASMHRTQWRVGNPTITGFGIDALYKSSDRRQWLIPCPHCGERQAIDWFAQVVREESEGMYSLRGIGRASAGPRVLCRRCQRGMDRLCHGEWVAEFPGREASGYHISQLFSGSVSLEAMWTEFQEALRDETRLQRFYNSVLGLPYEATGARLTEAMLIRACGDFPRLASGKGCYMGVDVGSQIHVIVIDPSNQVIHIGTVQEFEELDPLMNAYGVETCVIDMLPETRKAREFGERFSSLVYLCQFVKSEDVPDFKLSPDDMKVRADRTQTMDDSHAALTQGIVKLPRDSASVRDFYPQMLAPTRLFDAHRQRFIWTEGNDADHYRLAFCYAWLAKRVFERAGKGAVYFG